MSLRVPTVMLVLLSEAERFERGIMLGSSRNKTPQPMLRHSIIPLAKQAVIPQSKKGFLMFLKSVSSNLYVIVGMGIQPTAPNTTEK